MSKRKPRDPSKERHWRSVLRQWRLSGLSIRAFCQQHDLSEPNFYSWRRLLAQRDAEAPAFVPVQLLSDPHASQPRAEVSQSSAAASSGLELLLGKHVLRIGPAFDPATLRRLLAVLQERQP